MGGPAGRPSAASVIVGRDAEQAQLAEFLEGRAELVAALVTGPAGIGKTALWEWTLEQAASRGYLVLVSRAGVAEVQLPWVGLTDLLRPMAGSALDGLPPPQRQALQVVMLQSDLGQPVDERAVGTALRFALRRMGSASRVRLLATARGDGLSWAPLDGLPAGQVRAVGVGPVTVGALYELLADRLAVRLARPVLLRVHETSAGNPLYALELARALDRLEIVPRPGVPLPVPTSLDDLVAARVPSLPPEVLRIAHRAGGASAGERSGLRGDDGSGPADPASAPAGRHG